MKPGSGPSRRCPAASADCARSSARGCRHSFRPRRIWARAAGESFPASAGSSAQIEFTSPSIEKKSLAHVLAARDEAAIAGADRIDEDEIGKVEPGLGIGLQIGRGGRNRRVAADGDPPRPGRCRIASKRRLRPGPPLKKNVTGRLARIGAVQLIGGIGDIGLRLALVVEQPDRSRGRCEGQRAAGERLACA